ncbi:hypothetical protein A1D22_02075 [Pasteurellaceae bacterium LFhippo2]|nr:hypothetical protein [Pasteurellaceae bacterium LFhippo2]
MTNTQRPYWFVGASYGGNDDQTDLFVTQGIWNHGKDDINTCNSVLNMKVGDKIAIKSVFTQKYDLPFDNPKNHTYSVLRIKAIGTIVGESLDNGYSIKVDWQKDFEPKNWYHYVYQGTIWLVNPNRTDSESWKAKALIDFTFNNKPQDFSLFTNNGSIADNEDVAFTTTVKTIDYTIANIQQDGCFLEQKQLEDILFHLKFKKNLILQGAPGTGKTWLAKRLAYAIIQQKDSSKVKAVQFHPNLSYEDFVRGWRPNGDGKLSLQDGSLMEITKKALNDPNTNYVLVIEEINRGNPAQIFGEMLTLLESDKRNPESALELAYKVNEYERIYLPNNLYIIGTMNIADRSLALVDFALRRRFSFVELEPNFSNKWQNWLKEKFHFDDNFIKKIHSRILQVNEQICQELGDQFRIGHSYFTPPENCEIQPEIWFKQVVQNEIIPLLNEYWFDSPEKAQQVANLLIENR